VKYTHLFWDFNGTILADMQAGMDSTNQMLRDRGINEIDGLDEYREVFGFPIKEYYRSLGFDFDSEPYEVLAPIWVDLYNENSKNCPMIEGVSETLKAVSSLGVAQIVFSATEKEMLRRQLAELGVIHYFDEIMGLDNIHAASKAHLAKTWRKEHPEARVLYVGDTVHDAENAKILEADCLLFTGGHQSKRRLAACGCKMIDKIEELIDYIK
jgi:phosphoglycolate phosphatase